MKVKTSEIKGAALCWAVAKARGLLAYGYNSDRGFPELLWVYNNIGGTECFTPHTDWSQGGPIIHAERISIRQNGSATVAYIISADGNDTIGPACPPNEPLLAAMRCYITAWFGDEVDVPEELL